jgi:pectate lyase
MSIPIAEVSKQMIKKNIAIYVLFSSMLFGKALAQPAFPGAEGYGAMSVGGRGGRVIEVTNLNDSGSGSLRAAVETSGARIVIFRVSGTIELQKALKIKYPYITIAGQTAPGGRICLKGYNFNIAADHVIVRYMRFRLGDNTLQETDTVTVSSGRNIILDHCSASWSVDETLSTDVDTNVMGNLTVQWCMITESLDCSIHSKGCHGYGSLLRGCYNNGYSFHHNLYAHHKGRSPRPGNYNSYTTDPDGLILDFRNNVIYNWGGSYAGYNADTTSVTKMNFVCNYYKTGPNSTNSYAYQESCTYCRAYFSDNWMNGICPADPWSLVRFSGFTEAAKAAYMLSSPLSVAQVNTDDALTAYGLVLADAGATFPERDTADVRVINEVVDGTGGIINDEDEVGGWPELASTAPPQDSDHDGMPDDWELAHCLDPSDSSDANGDRDGDGYTNIEEYINWLPLREPMPIRVDLNCDDIVDLNDFSEFAEHYCCSYGGPLYDKRCDFNSDDVISIEDLFYFVQNWLRSGQE